MKISMKITNASLTLIIVFPETDILDKNRILLLTSIIVSILIIIIIGKFQKFSG